MGKKASNTAFNAEAAARELGIQECKDKELINRANTSFEGGLRGGPTGDEYMQRADGKIYQGSFKVGGETRKFPCFLAKVFNAAGEYLRPCSVPASLLTRNYYTGEALDSESVPAIEGLSTGSANERFNLNLKIGFDRFEQLYKADFVDGKRSDKNKKGNCALYRVL